MLKAAAGAVIAVLAVVPGAAQAEQLRVAIIEALSGPQASTGVLYKDAVHYVIGKMNASGGYNGGKIVVTEYDSAGTTAGATAQFKKAVADGVHAVVQGGSSAIAGQLSDDIREHNAGHPGREVLYLNVGAEALELTGSKCHFHSFRFTSTAPMRIGALVRVMKEDGSLGRRVYSINQDYSWGKDVEAAIKANAAQGGYEVVASVLHKVNSIQDFAPFVAEIQAAKPDTVMTGNWSNDLLLMMKAAGAAGLKVRFATTFLDQVGNIGNAGQLTVGHYVAHPFNIELTDGKFARDYEKVTGHVPVYVEPGAVNGMSIFTKGLAATDFNGGAIDVNKVVLAMEQVRYDTALGPLSVRKEDHQMITPIVVSRVEPDVQYPVDGTNLGFEPVKAVPAEQVMYPVQDTCKMKRP